MENTEFLYENDEFKTKIEDEDTIKEGVCPVCGSNYLVINGRCVTCYSCGYSLCSM